MSFRGVLSPLDIRPANTPADPVRYAFVLDDVAIPLNERLGDFITLRFSGKIVCRHCAMETPQSFRGGYCFACSTRLARADLCMVRPTLCHFRAGTCREPQWGALHCWGEHIVYLANASGPKVGITAGSGDTRWLNQGACQGLRIFRAVSRHHAGMLEAELAVHIDERTDWRTMVTSEPLRIDLPALRDALLRRCDVLHTKTAEAGYPALPPLLEESTVTFTYPVLEYPLVPKALDPARFPLVQGRLLGMKGQYLLLDWGVLNVRKFAGWEVSLEL